jgi:hypothetical protein
MGFRQQAAALRIQLPPGPKNVLNILAFHACDLCGRAWPGVPTVALETGLSQRAVQDALKELRERPELVTVYRYPKGGRGVSTEYLVMPELAKLSTAECGRCGNRTDTLHLAHPLTSAGPVKGANRGSKRVRQTYHQQSIQPQQSSYESPKAAGNDPKGPSPAVGLSASGPDGPAVEPPPESPLSEPHPPTAPQTAAEVKAYVDALASTLHLPGRRTGQPRPPAKP